MDAKPSRPQPHDEHVLAWHRYRRSLQPRWARMYTKPDGSITKGILFDSFGAASLGDPRFGGVCPGYTTVGYAARVPGGWWRTKRGDPRYDTTVEPDHAR